MNRRLAPPLLAAVLAGCASGQSPAALPSTPPASPTASPTADTPSSSAETTSASTTTATQAPSPSPRPSTPPAYLAGPTFLRAVEREPARPGLLPARASSTGQARYGATWAAKLGVPAGQPRYVSCSYFHGTIRNSPYNEYTYTLSSQPDPTGEYGLPDRSIYLQLKREKDGSGQWIDTVKAALHDDDDLFTGKTSTSNAERGTRPLVRISADRRTVQVAAVISFGPEFDYSREVGWLTVAATWICPRAVPSPAP